MAIRDGGFGMGDGHDFDVGQLRQGFQDFAEVAFNIDETETDFAGKTQSGGGRRGKCRSRSCQDVATRIPHSKDCVTPLIQSRRMHFSRRQFLGLLPAAAALAQPAKAKMNVIVILADDLGAMDLGCYGSKYHETPNLDALAAGGMRFTQAYAACPVCSPTRASIMTGKYPARLQLTDWIPGRRQWSAAKLLTPAFEQALPLKEVTVAEVLKPAGYTTASIGKWHLGGDGFLPTEQGFDLNVGGTERGSPPSYFPPYKIPGLDGRGEQDYLTDNLTARAEQFIESNKEKPFFLYLPHFAVHTPLQAKKDLTAKYERKAEGMKAQSRPVYAAMLESLDEGVGRILRKLDELKIADRTAVFFLSDNGGLRFEGSQKQAVTDNAPLRAGKGHLFEGGIRIPMLVRWPGVTKPGATVAHPVCSVDLLPTIAQMAGLEAPVVDGVSLAGTLKSGSAPKRDFLFWHYPHYSNQGGSPGGAIRRGDWKLIEFYEDGRLELYNLKDDPGERVNLAVKKKGVAEQMLHLLRQVRMVVKATMPKSNPYFDADKADQGLTGVEAPTPAV
ncbi:MAG: sulfatase [Bryobacterales bacterium]|nr:sulfatase [Bryobacterales bacterium]